MQSSGLMSGAPFGTGDVSALRDANSPCHEHVRDLFTAKLSMGHTVDPRGGLSRWKAIPI